MMKQYVAMATFLFTLFVSTQSIAQKSDPVLFVVEDTPVKVSEFQYIYDKTNGDNADYSKASLEEYMDLYVKFKLKVQKAKDMQLDTISSLQEELAGYRQQLADSYLLDREVTDRLIEEAYNRKKQDIDISHILLRVPANATPEDTLKAYNRIQSIKQELNGGKTFEQLATTYSEDPSSKNNGGRVGFITAVLPTGFYELESTAYELPLGQISDVIRSGFGYHLVKVNERRPARGLIEVAHILIRKDKDGTNRERAQQVAQKVYDELRGGANFEEAVKRYSEDQLTAGKNGYLGEFGINKYEDVFEDAAFGIADDGGIAGPVETKAGFHIIQRISKKGVQPFNETKGRLEQQIRQGERFQLAVNSMVNRIRKDAGFRENEKALTMFRDTISKEFTTFRWRAPEKVDNVDLFTLGNAYNVSLGDFLAYAQSAARQRINLGREGKTMPEVVDLLYRDFQKERILKYEEAQLEKKYPDFKALMREYEEGILLFEATKRLVWDKASQDTVGLRQFYNNNANNYQWEDRIVVTSYTITSGGAAQLEDIRNYAATNDMNATLKKFNKGGKEVIQATQRTVERGRDKQLDALEWKAGTLGKSRVDRSSQLVAFDKIERVEEPTNKSLQEARGYVVADYQDFLEKQWVNELRDEYNVKVNKRVFNKLVQN
jgi:peptidyl-prolyl cis-trans isomerase SurA